MNIQELFSKVKELGLSPGEYVLFDSAPMGIRGLRDCHDVDILVTQDEWDKYRDRAGWVVRVGPRGDDYLENGDLELWKNWAPGDLDVQKLIDEADVIDDLPFVRLNSVMEWKKLNAREKDLKDVEIIANFLKTENK